MVSLYIFSPRKYNISVIFDVLFQFFLKIYVFFFFLGEPLTVQEAFTYMKFLIGFEGTFDAINDKSLMSIDFTFLPEVYLSEMFFNV